MLLRPGLTANADILVASIDTALLVPNGALRFTPPDEIVKIAPPLPHPRNGEQLGRVWVMTGTVMEARDLRIGRTDGRMTEVSAGTLRRGEKVVTDLTAAGAPAPATAPSSSGR